jgi:hypothetical protein
MQLKNPLFILAHFAIHCYRQRLSADRSHYDTFDTLEERYVVNISTIDDDPAILSRSDLLVRRC